MKRNRRIALVFVLLFSLSSCYSRILNPYSDTPDENCGVGRITEDGEKGSVEQWKSGAEEEAAPVPAVVEPEDDAASAEDAASEDARSEPEDRVISPEPETEVPSEEEDLPVPADTVPAEEPAAPAVPEEPLPAEETPAVPEETLPAEETPAVIPDADPGEEPTGGDAQENVDSLAPFGAVRWRKENGIYRYDFPARNTAGADTLDEMYDFPRARLDDANKAPEKDNWFPGKVFYDEATGEVTYYWDRWDSTKEVLNRYGAIYRGDETRKVCYLTFDCGYEYGATAAILDALRDKEAPGTFFVTGPYVRSQVDLVRRMLDEGHVVGNHTNTHPDMTSLTVDQVIDEMRQVEGDFKAQFPDAPELMFFRPPEGAVNEWLLRLEAKLGYRTVMWSYTYYDFDVNNQWDYDDALNTLKSHLHPGCVYLLHAESSTNAAVLPELIDWIRSQGYEIEPVCGIKA